MGFGEWIKDLRKTVQIHQFCSMVSVPQTFDATAAWSSHLFVTLLFVQNCGRRRRIDIWERTLSHVGECLHLKCWLHQGEPRTVGNSTEPNGFQLSSCLRVWSGNVVEKEAMKGTMKKKLRRSFPFSSELWDPLTQTGAVGVAAFLFVHSFIHSAQVLFRKCLLVTRLCA